MSVYLRSKNGKWQNSLILRFGIHVDLFSFGKVGDVRLRRDISLRHYVWKKNPTFCCIYKIWQILKRGWRLLTYFLFKNYIKVTQLRSITVLLSIISITDILNAVFNLQRNLQWKWWNHVLINVLSIVGKWGWTGRLMSGTRLFVVQYQLCTRRVIVDSWLKSLQY